MIKFGWDAGHGLHTAGKRTPDGEREWTFNNIIGLAFAAELSKYEGIELKRFDDPTGQKDVPLSERTNGALNWGAEYYISYHQNAYLSVWGTHGGVETFIYTNPNAKSTALANAVHPVLVQGYGLRNRGIKKENLHIVREMQRKEDPKGVLDKAYGKKYVQTGIGVILVEGGFMDSTTDIATLRDSNKLRNAGYLIAQAVAKHLGLKLKAAPTPTPPVFDQTAARNVALHTLSQVAHNDIAYGLINEIKAAVKDGRFSSKHEDVHNYDFETLKAYALIALARKK